MQFKLKYYGKVADGLLKIIHRANFDHDLKMFEGKEIEITITKKRKQRSGQQNRYYWGAVLSILKNSFAEHGMIYSIEEIHDMMRFKFITESVPVGKDGEFITRIKSTTELTASEMADYISEIQHWASEMLNVIIPDPNEQITMSYEL